MQTQDDLNALYTPTRYMQTQDDLNALYTPGPWPLPPGVAQTLSVIYACYSKTLNNKRDGSKLKLKFRSSYDMLNIGV
jgi:hypothetical protein